VAALTRELARQDQDQDQDQHQDQGGKPVLNPRTHT
jgi:hypothetical protein